MPADEADTRGECDQRDRDDKQDAHEAVELALERAAPSLSRRQRAGNPAELRVAGRCHHYSFAAAADDAGAGVGD